MFCISSYHSYLQNRCKYNLKQISPKPLSIYFNISRITQFNLCQRYQCYIAHIFSPKYNRHNDAYYQSMLNIFHSQDKIPQHNQYIIHQSRYCMLTTHHTKHIFPHLAYVQSRIFYIMCFNLHSKCKSRIQQNFQYRNRRICLVSLTHIQSRTTCTRQSCPHSSCMRSQDS